MDSSTNPIEQSVVSELAAQLEQTKGGPDMDLYLIAFNDGSYKKIRAKDWKHSQWIHFTLPDGSVVRVNPANVNYMHQGVSDG